MIVHVYSGLTSRCITLAEAYYLTNKSGEKNLTIIWPIEEACGIHFNEVFAADMFSDIKVRVVELKKYRPIKGADGGIRRHIKNKEFWKALICIIEECRKRWRICSDKVRKRVWRLGKYYCDYNPPQEIGWRGDKYIEYTQNVWLGLKEELAGKRECYIHAYAGMICDEEKEDVDVSVIKFKQEHWNKVNSILTEPENIVGVHIRRTDHAQAIQGSGTGLFIKAMNEEIDKNADVKFFLATDDIIEEENLKKMFGDRIITQKGKKWGRGSSEEIKAGIIDFLCLSRCKYILGSCGSNFSDFSASYGGKKLIICKE